MVQSSMMDTFRINAFQFQPIRKQLNSNRLLYSVFCFLNKFHYQFFMITIFQTMQGLKRKRRCQNQCFQHLFSLRNLNNNPKYDIELTFCPKYQRQPLPAQHTFSEYNNDGLFYTSAFTLGVDKKLIAKNLQKEMLDHQKLIKQNCQKYNQIVFPRPNSKHTTCSVCKQTYKNYYSHIFSDEHSDKIQSSSYNYYIKQLCQLFNNLWDGCAEKADQQALNQTETDKREPSKIATGELNLDDILQQQEINSRPSQLLSYQEQRSQEKQVIMRRPVKVYEPLQPAKIIEDRNSRKKNINFAQFFQEYPKKKVINDHRQAVTVSAKKVHKTPQIQETKPTQISVIKKQNIAQESNPFIIEYNARGKRKQKKSYYYLKKKQRQERERLQRQMLLGQKNDQNPNQTANNRQQSQQQISPLNQDQISHLNQDQIQISSVEEYEKYIEEFHQEQKKNKETTNANIKSVSNGMILFEQVEKKSFPTPIFGSTLNNSDKFPTMQKPLINSIALRKNSPQKSTINPETKPSEKMITQRITFPISATQNKSSGQMQSRQQISNKNKINSPQQNQLLLYHKFKNPLQKQVSKQNESKPQKDNQQVFDQYEQKFRQYQQQKENSLRLKIPQKTNVYEQRRNNSHFIGNAQSMADIKKGYISNQQQDACRYSNEKYLLDQRNSLGMSQVKTEGLSRNTSFSQAYYKRALSQNQLSGNLTTNAINQKAPSYSNTDQFYPGYPMPSYGYSMHDRQKADRLPIKYGQQRQNQAFDRGYYYGGWQTPYFISTPPGAVLPPQINGVEGAHKSFQVSPYTNPKEQSKPIVYSGYQTEYACYPPTNYHGYYPTPGAPYPPTQRPQYSPHPSSNMRVPPQPNTSININFPMYLGHPYHGAFQHQSNPQRYGHQSPGAPQGPYLPPNQTQNKPLIQPCGPEYNSNAPTNLPPYAEYQEYKKRQSQRRR